MDEDKERVIESYIWSWKALDYCLVYRGTDEAEAKRAQRKAAQAEKKYYREHKDEIDQEMQKELESLEKED